MSIEQTIMSQTDFAQHLGVQKSYVTQLKKAGRLVMAADGRRVDVVASLARIEATRSPDKAAVAARHAAARGDDRPEQEGEPDEPEADADARPDYQAARARREAANAELAEIELAERAGKLVEVARVESVLADALTTLRTGLESMGVLLSPQLAHESDPHEIRQIIDDHVHAALSELSARFLEQSRRAGGRA